MRKLLAVAPIVSAALFAPTTVFRGVLPFIGADIVRLALLILFPSIALWLPSLMR